ncbi:MAG: hypothetical protein GX183_00015 [Firmicutes bacterium]|nr:hypothetical protein [Bacillota bacterium]
MEFQGASWQRCQPHFTKNTLDVCPKPQQEHLRARLRLMLEAHDMNTAYENRTYSTIWT